MLASMRTSRLAAAAPTRPSRTAVVVRYTDGKRHAPLIDRLGGADGLRTAVDIFYGKVRSAGTGQGRAAQAEQQQQ
jgi:hypothetical protein